MRKLAWGLIIAALAMIFALQNADPVPVHFFFWKIESVSLAMVLLITFISGVITGLMFLAPRLMKKSNKDKMNTARDTKSQPNQNSL
ncbi:MAG: lipopolysaccharide assembly LapA domain-containing protein [Bacteroidota bacterium]